MEYVLHNIGYKFALIALTETWYTNPIIPTPRILPGYQKSGISCTTRKSGCDLDIIK